MVTPPEDIRWTGFDRLRFAVGSDADLARDVRTS